MVAKPLPTPVTAPVAVVVATLGESDWNPVVRACDVAFESAAVADACFVSPIFSGLSSVTVMPVVVGDGAAALPESEPPHAAKAAQRTKIRFHGLRHTCASLLVAAGEPINVIAARLGHAKISMTLDTYSHALPTQQQQAADTIGAILHQR